MSIIVLIKLINMHEKSVTLTNSTLCSVSITHFYDQVAARQQHSIIFFDKRGQEGLIMGGERGGVGGERSKGIQA